MGHTAEEWGRVAVRGSAREASLPFFVCMQRAAAFYPLGEGEQGLGGEGRSMRKQLTTRWLVGNACTYRQEEQQRDM